MTQVFLDDVYCDEVLSIEMLYLLLAERTQGQSISHSEMPSFMEHKHFVLSHPYEAWYLVHDSQTARTVGATYLSKRREIGIFLFKEFISKGYGPAAVKALMQRHNGKFYANCNPANDRSVRMFRRLGFEPLQLTLVREQE